MLQMYSELCYKAASYPTMKKLEAFSSQLIKPILKRICNLTT